MDAEAFEGTSTGRNTGPDTSAVGASAAEPWWVPTLFDFDQLRDSLNLDIDTRLPDALVPVLSSGHGGVLGAQMLAQQVVAAESYFDGFAVLHSGLVFLRPSSCARPLRVSVRPLAQGRTVVQASVSYVQDGDIIAEGLVQLRADEVEPEHRGSDGPVEEPMHLPASESASTTTRSLWPWPTTSQLVSDDGASSQWARVPSAVEGMESRALLAFATESISIPLAIDLRGERPFGGVLAQAVVSHRITYLAPFSAARWHRHVARIAGTRGRNVVGNSQVHDERGAVVATTETTAVLGGPSRSS